MIHHSIQDCITDLDRGGYLLRIDQEIDAHLVAAEIHRRVFAAGGPALLFSNVRGCQFPMASNLFGTMDRVRYIFRHTLENVRRLISLKTDPQAFWSEPRQNLRAGLLVRHMLPMKRGSGPILRSCISISQLPQLKCWPQDGGAFVTLPIVYSEHAEQPGLTRSNLGMYRVQLSGNQYAADQQIGLHYQIHRGIGVHHKAAMDAGKPFRVNIFVGGTPAMSVAAVMPLPEGISELSFAGALAGHRIPMITRNQPLPIYGDADFTITGTVDPNRMLPEGPFGDHLGYYSLSHDFPVLNVERVYHRPGAIWPFTVVGRPPQEDTMFGKLIHELTRSVIPTVVPGVHAVHAVDAAGVHPLMLAIGSERYTPYQPTGQPQELLTQANAILGQGQMSLAKYLLIVARGDCPQLDVADIPAFFRHLLERVDWQRDLHFQTRTTIDTLDYSGTGLNQGSKVVIAAVGPTRRELPAEVPRELTLPTGFADARVTLPGILAVKAPSLVGATPAGGSLAEFCRFYETSHPINQFPVVLLVDDSQFVGHSVNNFLWATFTRSNPAADIDGIAASVENKHWGCRGALVIDARRKRQHAPPLVCDPDVVAEVDAMAARGGPLGKWL